MAEFDGVTHDGVEFLLEKRKTVMKGRKRELSNL